MNTYKTCDCIIKLGNKFAFFEILKNMIGSDCSLAEGLLGLIVSQLLKIDKKWTILVGYTRFTVIFFSS